MFGYRKASADIDPCKEFLTLSQRWIRLHAVSPLTLRMTDTDLQTLFTCMSDSTQIRVDLRCHGEGAFAGMCAAAFSVRRKLPELVQASSAGSRDT